MTLNQSNPAMAVINAEVRVADRRFLVRADRVGGASFGAVDIYRANGFTLAIPMFEVFIGCRGRHGHGVELARLWAFGQN